MIWMRQLRFGLLAIVVGLIGASRVEAYDANGNGLSDVWEWAYGYTPGADALPDDPDADGDGAAVENAFGTDPFDPGSKRPGTAPIVSSGNLLMAWVGALGVYYQVEGSADLSFWVPSGPGVVGDGTVLEASTAGPLGARGFLRVAAILPRPDIDWDGLDSLEEALFGSNATVSNTDSDLAADLEEFQLTQFGIEASPVNPQTLAGLPDGSGDNDRDGVDDLAEIRNGTSPRDSADSPAGHPNVDADRDGLRDAFELLYFPTLEAQNATGNPDGDRLTNKQEQALNLNPMMPQTNGIREDGLSDQDADNILDLWELEDGTNPLSAASQDLATNFVVLQGFMEHRSTWGSVADPAAQFSGVTLRAQAVGFENAQLTSPTGTYGIRNDVTAPFTNTGGNNYSVSRFLRFRKNVRYKVDLLNPNNVFAMPFVSAKYNWTSSGNADELAYTYFNYDVVNRQWYNRDPNDLVSPIAAVPTNATISPNPDVNNVHFTQKGAGYGGPESVMYPTGYLTLKPIQFVSAEGPTAGSLMRYISVYTAYDGIGQGMPIYDSPAANLVLSNLTASALNATFLGANHTLAANATLPNVYEDSGSGLTITLLSAPLADPGVQERITVELSQPSIGIADARYIGLETSANASAFSDIEHGIVAVLSGLDPGVVDNLEVTFFEENYSSTLTLNETGNDTREFAEGNYTIRLVNNSTLSGAVDTLHLFVIPPPAVADRPVLSVVETGPSSRVFRNFDEPIPTDLPASTAEGAAFRLRTLARLGGNSTAPPMRIRFKPSAGGGSPSAWIDVPLTESSTAGVYESVEKLVLVPDNAPPVPGYLNVPVPVGQIDFSSTAKEVDVDLGPSSEANDSQPEAMVVQSLDLGSGFSQGLDPEKEIMKPIADLGYKTYLDLKATTQKAIDDYAPGKQVWYSVAWQCPWRGIADGPGRRRYGRGFSRTSVQGREDRRISQRHTTRPQESELPAGDGGRLCQRSDRRGQQGHSDTGRFTA
jgi:hypothetical protein